MGNGGGVSAFRAAQGAPAQFCVNGRFCLAGDWEMHVVLVWESSEAWSLNVARRSRLRAELLVLIGSWRRREGLGARVLCLGQVCLCVIRLYVGKQQSLGCLCLV